MPQIPLAVQAIESLGVRVSGCNNEGPNLDQALATFFCYFRNVSPRLLLFFFPFFICLLVSSVIPAYPKDLNEFGALEGGSGSGRLL